jgi:hypothetical protein
VGVFPSCHEVSGAFAAPGLGLPPDVLDDRGLVFESPWHVSTDLSGIAGGPGAFTQSASGRGVPGVGHGPVLAPLPRGIGCRDPPQEFHQVSWVSDTRHSSHFCSHGDGHRAWHPTQGLKGRDHRVQTPRFDRCVAFLCETLEAFGGCVDGSDLFLATEWLGRGGTHDGREPPEMGRAPMCPARVADSVPEPAGLETALGVLEIAEGLFTRPRAVSSGFLFDLGDIDRGAITRARQAGPLHGVPTIRCDPITRLVGQQRGRHDPAVVGCFPQLAVEPGATRTGCIDKDQRFGRRLPLSDELIEVTLTWPHGSQVGHLRAVRLGPRQPPQSSLGGHPGRCRVCSTGTWLTSECTGDVPTAGGSGFGEAHPRDIGGQPPAIRSHYV